MKIRITDPGFANYTGYLGSSYFVDGICDDVSAAEAERMASIVRVEEFESGANPSVTQRMVDLVNKNADEMGINSNAVLVKTAAVDPILPITPESTVADPVGEIDPAVVQLSYDFTLDDLSALVDNQGFAGLRAFAEPYGVGGRSISGVIEDLMALKAIHCKPAQVEPVTEVVEPVTEVVEPVVETEVVTPTEPAPVVEATQEPE